MTNIHASCVVYKDKGVLICGKSGSGKSDLSLRLIMDKGFSLVGDDRIDIFEKRGKLRAYSVNTIANMLEVRGLGLMYFSSKKAANIELVVDLAENMSEVVRLPEPEFIELEGIKIPKITIWPFEASATDKVLLALMQKPSPQI